MNACAMVYTCLSHQMRGEAAPISTSRANESPERGPRMSPSDVGMVGAVAIESTDVTVMFGDALGDL